jgi:uncharacterized membrane protein YphA (DoxX/SURF4 family)
MGAMMLETDEKLNLVWWLMRIALGLGLFLAGLDKFFDLLTTWSMYLSPLAEGLLPVSGEVFLRGVGIVEMAVGIAILTRWTEAGAYVMCAWLVGIALNLALAAHFWDLVLRDLETAVSAFALARLSAWRAATVAAYAPPPPAALREKTI